MNNKTGNKSISLLLILIFVFTNTAYSSDRALRIPSAVQYARERLEQAVDAVAETSIPPNSNLNNFKPDIVLLARQGLSVEQIYNTLKAKGLAIAMPKSVPIEEIITAEQNLRLGILTVVIQEALKSKDFNNVFSQISDVIHIWNTMPKEYQKAIDANRQTLNSLLSGELLAAGKTMAVNVIIEAQKLVSPIIASKKLDTTAQALVTRAGDTFQSIKSRLEKDRVDPLEVVTILAINLEKVQPIPELERNTVALMFLKEAVFNIQFPKLIQELKPAEDKSADSSAGELLAKAKTRAISIIEKAQELARSIDQQNLDTVSSFGTPKAMRRDMVTRAGDTFQSIKSRLEKDWPSPLEIIAIATVDLGKMRQIQELKGNTVALMFLKEAGFEIQFPELKLAKKESAPSSAGEKLASNATASMVSDTEQQLQTYSPSILDFIDARRVEISPDGNRIFLLDSEGQVRVLGPNGESIGILRAEGVRIGEKYIKGLPNGNILTRDSDGQINIWRPDGESIAIIEEGGLGWSEEEVKAILCLPNGNILIQDSEWKISIFGQDGEYITSLESERIRIGESHIEGLLDGSILTKDSDGELRIRRLDGYVTVLRVEGVEVGKYSIKVLPNGNIATSDADGQVRIWGPHGEFITTLGTMWIGAGREFIKGLSNNNILTKDIDGQVRIWGSDGKFIAILEAKKIGLGIGPVSILPNDDILIKDSDGRYRVWSGLNGRLIGILEDRETEAQAISIGGLFNGNIVIQYSDGQVRIWRKNETFANSAEPAMALVSNGSAVIANIADTKGSTLASGHTINTEPIILEEAYNFLTYIKRGMGVSLWDMKILLEAYLSEMKDGLAGNNSSLQMIPAYVAPPTGLETGNYYFLDVGGSNLRVGGVNLLGKGQYPKIGAIKEAKFNGAYTAVTATASGLFGYIADNIADYLETNKIDTEDDIIFGLTWSFPVTQTGVDSGVHKAWTKAWQTQGVVGQDPVKLLRDAISQNPRLEGKRIIIQALCNDTVGTFAAGRYVDADCDEGVILGTGTNASYAEEIANITKWKGKAFFPQMCINQEWGAFNNFRWTEWDEQLDAYSDNPGRQALEKKVSGMYLGEIARLIFQDLITKKILFGGRSSKAFDEKWHEENNPSGFQASYMARIIADNSEGLEETRALLKELGIANSTIKDRNLLKEVSMVVAERGARIAATVMLATIMKNDPNLEKRHSIAIDGSLFEKFPFFKACMEKALSELAGSNASKIKLFLAKDGSGVGAAILAAVAHNTAKSLASNATVGKDDAKKARVVVTQRTTIPKLRSQNPARVKQLQTLKLRGQKLASNDSLQDDRALGSLPDQKILIRVNKQTANVPGGVEVVITFIGNGGSKPQVVIVRKADEAARDTVGHVKDYLLRLVSEGNEPLDIDKLPGYVRDELSLKIEIADLSQVGLGRTALASNGTATNLSDLKTAVVIFIGDDVVAKPADFASAISKLDGTNQVVVIAEDDAQKEALDKDIRVRDDINKPYTVILAGELGISMDTISLQNLLDFTSLRIYRLTDPALEQKTLKALKEAV